MANWLLAAHTRLEQPGEQTLPPQANLACAVVEMDELYAFVGAKRGTKKPPLSAHHMDRESRCIVSWDLVTQRTEATLQPLLDKLWQQSPHPVGLRRFYSDGFPVYPTLVYRHGQQQSLPDKSQTYSGEGVNADLRCYISSLVRRTRGFARRTRGFARRTRGFARRTRGFARQLASLRRRVWLFVYCYNRRRLAVQRPWERRWPALAATHQTASPATRDKQRRRLRQCLLYRFPLIHFLPALF